jgi:hypothetical protein
MAFVERNIGRIRLRPTKLTCALNAVAGEKRDLRQAIRADLDRELMAGYEIEQTAELAVKIVETIPWAEKVRLANRGLITHPGCGSLDGQVGAISQL